MTNASPPRSPLKRVGSLWRPKPGSKSKGSGSITVNGLRQKFVILVNDKKAEGSAQPDYLLMSADQPEIDPFVAGAPKDPVSKPPAPAEADEDMPF